MTNEMTVEEAIKWLKDIERSFPEAYFGEWRKALRMAIKALEQQPSEDCISRQAVIDYAKDTCLDLDKDEDTEIFCDEIKAMTPVTPERQKGKWITWKEAGNYIPSETRFECSVCHDAAQTLCNGLDLLSPYCPNCGAEMEEG